MEKRFKIRKVFIDELINALHDLYDQGVEFVDIDGTVSDVRDRVEFVVKDEYYIPEITKFSPLTYDELIYMGP